MKTFATTNKCDDIQMQTFATTNKGDDIEMQTFATTNKGDDIEMKTVMRGLLYQNWVMDQDMKIFVAVNCFVAGFLVIGLYFNFITPAPPLCSKGRYSLVSYISDRLLGHHRDRWIIYVCDYGKSCGELPLRLDGIISAYLFSVLSSRKFGIIFTKPVALQHVLQPVNSSWIVNPGDLGFASCNYYNHMFDRTFADRLKTANLDWQFPEEVVYIKLRRYYWNSLYENSLYRGKLRELGYTPAGTFHHAFVKLFEPQPKFRKTVLKYSNQFKAHFSTELVCVLTYIDRGPQVQTGPTLWQFLDRFAESKNTHFLVSSANLSLVSEAKTRFGDKFSAIAGSLNYIDGDVGVMSTGENLGENLETNLLDFYSLIQCDKLVLECGSDLGRVVAYSRNINQGLYYLQNGAVRELDLDALSMDYEEGRCPVRITNQVEQPQPKRSDLH